MPRIPLINISPELPFADYPSDRNCTKTALKHRVSGRSRPELLFEKNALPGLQMP